MKIFYHGQGGWNSKPAGLANIPNLLALEGNNWDDFGNKTTLDASLYFDGERFDFDFHLKLLIEGRSYTALALNEMKNAGWDGFFPIPNANYISLPSDIDFYHTLLSKLGEKKAITLLRTLKDAGFLINIDQDESASALSESDEFSSSVLRESGAIKAYTDGWRIFDGSLNEINSFELNILTAEMQSKKIPFRFNSTILPYDINILIGPNGIGKSYCLKSFVEYWLKTGIGSPKHLKRIGHTPFDTPPNISKLILVSYSPFEEFTLDLSKAHLKDKQAYKYFGFRYQNEKGEVGINRNLPSFNSAESIIKALFEDEKFSFIENRVEKVATVGSALSSALSFDYMALEVKDDSLLSPFSQLIVNIDDKSYLRLLPEIVDSIAEVDLLSSCNLVSGVCFIKAGAICQLSSGQRLFTYIVINVVAELRENSLVVIDEPELFLHPTLEVEFVSLLKLVLQPFKSKAILATHSLSVVREVPSNCVHIFRDEGYGLDVIKPPFETFGGDMQRISSYVFGDRSVTKPFEDLLAEQIKKYSPERLIELLGDEINEELTMKILRLGRQNGR
ncbi:AAA family ATPase [Shewanella sp. 10N.286.45.A1]|uniref:AAA family ATPase n=1 Tax=Shewanella sp. 10N.286.45.A1 TaxID=3229694 RepID=UPI00354F088F